jgi:hypothetical protein
MGWTGTLTAASTSADDSCVLLANDRGSVALLQ